jgi:hypothetical protein
MRAPSLAVLASLLAGCLGAPAPAEQPTLLPPPVAVAPLAFENATGTLLALPVVGGEAQFTYDVPRGATWVAATLKWATRGSALNLTALDPDGHAQGQARTLAGSSPRAPARLDWWSEGPQPGPWTFVVSGQAALQEPLRLQFHTLPRHDGGMHVAEDTTVPQGRFVEVNTEMKRGETLRFAWTTAQPVAFNIHAHRDGQTTNVVEDTTDAMDASYTAEDDGGYSLLWEVPSDTPLPGEGPGVALRYRVDGDYALHSAAG